MSSPSGSDQLLLGNICFRFFMNYLLYDAFFCLCNQVTLLQKHNFTSSLRQFWPVRWFRNYSMLGNLIYLIGSMCTSNLYKSRYTLREWSIIALIKPFAY